MRKKLLFTMLALMACLSNAKADPSNDFITISDVEIKRGTHAVVTVNYNITYDDDIHKYRDFEIHMTLPQGITMTEDEIFVGTDIYNAAPQMLIKGNTTDDGDVVFVSFQIDDKDFRDGTGELMRFTLMADENCPKGTFTASTTKIEFAETPGGVARIFENTSFNITVVDAPEWRILDENDNDMADNSSSNEYLEVKRSIQADTWSTICMPFDMNARLLKKVFGDGVKLAKFTQYTTTEREKELSDGTTKTSTVYTLNFELIPLQTNVTAVSGEALIANKPYIIKSEKAFDSFRLENMRVNANEDDAEFAWMVKRDWRASMVSSLYRQQLGHGSVFLSGNKLYTASNNTYIKGFRGYFQLDVLEEDTGANLNFMVDGELTDAIEGLTVDYKPMTDGKVYTISGVYMGRAEDLQGKLPSGLYIVNNKKVIVK